MANGIYQLLIHLPKMFRLLLAKREGVDFLKVIMFIPAVLSMDWKKGWKDILRKIKNISGILIIY